jgi:hypothetical protein
MIDITVAESREAIDACLQPTGFNFHDFKILAQAVLAQPQGSEFFPGIPDNPEATDTTFVLRSGHNELQARKNGSIVVSELDDGRLQERTVILPREQGAATSSHPLLKRVES